MRPGTAEVLLDGRDVTLWAYGALVRHALRAADALRRRGIEAGVVDARFAKPIDEELLGRHLRECRHIITVEEHQRAGGFGSAVLETASRTPDAVPQTDCHAGTPSTAWGGLEKLEQQEALKR